MQYGHRKVAKRQANLGSQPSRLAAFKSAIRKASPSGRAQCVADAREEFGILPVGMVAKSIAWPKL